MNGAITLTELQQDLENLLSEVDTGWSSDHTTIGIGGCLLVEMHRVVRMHVNNELADYRGATREKELRVQGMTSALGFGTSFGAMYDWNDRQDDPNVIKLRIKDALNNL